jgi:hypothetical protein
MCLHHDLSEVVNISSNIKVNGNIPYSERVKNMSLKQKIRLLLKYLDDNYVRCANLTRVPVVRKRLLSYRNHLFLHSRFRPLIMSTSITELTPSELRSILLFVIDLARKAGDLILEGSAAIQSVSSESGVGEKKNSVDLVTEYDVRVEELVKKELNSQYPTFHLYVESLLFNVHYPLTNQYRGGVLFRRISSHIVG